MSIILALIIFSVMVLFHEFGHFLLAKKNGIGVTEFSLGMGPRIASFVKGETRYSWKLIPFGGSCIMVGEDLDDKSENAFNSKSVWARISVVAAGPIFNFLLAFVLAIVYIAMIGYDKCSVVNLNESYKSVQDSGIQKGDVITEYDGEKIVIYRDLWLYQFVNKPTYKPIVIKYIHDGKKQTATVTPTKYYSLGISYYADKNPSKVGITKDSAVYKAGLRDNDIVTEIDGNSIETGMDISNYLKKNPLDGSEVSLKITRDGKEFEYNVKPQSGGYALGIDCGEYVKGTPLQVLRYSFTELRYDIQATFTGFKMLFTGKASRNDVSGPVGIVKVVGDSYEQTKSYGFKYVFLQMIYLIIVLSVNLGVVNLFPFPALDGGRLVFLFIEAVRGKPVPRDKEAIVHFAGMVILMLLMVLILFNDVTKFF